MSQIIPLGIGSPADIKRLVLTGLSPAALPPPPTPGEGDEFRIILQGVPEKSFNQFSSLIFTDGIEFTLPPYPIEVTWQTVYGTVPAIADIVIQLSINGSDWITKDESTDVNGEIRTFETSANFIRAAMLDMSEGILTDVIIVIKRITGGWY